MGCSASKHSDSIYSYTFDICLPFIIPKRPLKNRHWLEFTEYASIAGVATGAVASFFAKQALYLSTPLSIALLVGFANRRRVEQINEERTATSIATLKRKLSKQIKLIDQHIQTLPTPEMVGDVRNSTLRHSRDEMKQLTAKINMVREEMEQHVAILDDQNLGAVRDEVRQLQEFYTEMYGSLKRVQQVVDGLGLQTTKHDIETLVNQLRSESEQLKFGFQSLNDQTQPILSYLQEQVNHLNRQNSAILQQVDANSLKRELDILMDAVADLASKRDLNSVVADVRSLQEQQDTQGQSSETLRKQLKAIMQRLQSMPDVPQIRAQIEDNLSQQLRTIHHQLRTLPNSEQLQNTIKETIQRELETINEQLQSQTEKSSYKLIFDWDTSLFDTQENQASESQKLLDEALTTTKQRLIMVWPWSRDLRMDKPLMRKIEAFVKSGRQLDIGWCHITGPGDERFLSVIHRRWNLNSFHHQSTQTTLKYLLALKRRYPKQFKFRITGTVQNFLVADQSFAALGIEEQLTTITAMKDVSLKLWTTDEAVIQQLIQRFDAADLDPEDVESHWNRAMTRYDLGDRAGAVADLNHILETNSSYAAAYNLRAIIRFDDMDAVGALEDFDRSLALDAAQPSVYCNRGFLRSEQGDQYRAIADFSLAIQAEAHSNYAESQAQPKPKLGIAYFYRGLACQRLEDFAGAIADYTEALAQIHDSPVILYHRGITYQSTAQYALAIGDLETAATLFHHQGSESNARRAARHLAQARHAMEHQAADEPQPLPTLEIPLPINNSAGTDERSGTDAMPAHAMEHQAADELQPLPTLEIPLPINNSAGTDERSGTDAMPAHAMEHQAADELQPLPTLEIPLPINNTAGTDDRSATGAMPAQTSTPLSEIMGAQQSDASSSADAVSSDQSSSVATPSFLFPRSDRLRPSMIQDMDVEEEEEVSETEVSATDAPQVAASETEVLEAVSEAEASETVSEAEASEAVSETEVTPTEAPPVAVSDVAVSETEASEISAAATVSEIAVSGTEASEASPLQTNDLASPSLHSEDHQPSHSETDSTQVTETVTPEIDSVVNPFTFDPEESSVAEEDVTVLPQSESPLQAQPSVSNPPNHQPSDHLDKLVTSTLTNFLDEDQGDNGQSGDEQSISEQSDHEQLSDEKSGIQTLDNFFAVLQEDEEAAIAPSSAETESDAPYDERRESELSNLETSTLTGFFNHLSQADADAQSPDFFAEVSTQDISQNTLSDFHQVMYHQDGDESAVLADHLNQLKVDDTVDAGASGIPPQEQADDQTDSHREETNDAPDEHAETAAIALPNSFLSPDDPSSMNTFLEETSSEAVGDGTLIHFRQVLQVPSAKHETPFAEPLAVDHSAPEEGVVKHPPSDSTIGDVGNGLPAVEMSDRSDTVDDTQEDVSFMALTQTHFFNAVNTEDVSQTTLIGFMATLQDRDPAKPRQDTPSRDSGAAEPFSLEGNGLMSPARPVQDQSQPFSTNEMGAQSSILANTESSGTRSAELSGVEAKESSSSPFVSQAQRAEANEASGRKAPDLGTETLSNLMEAVKGEDLSTQTLSEFFSILREQKDKTLTVSNGNSLASGPERNGNGHNRTSLSVTTSNGSNGLVSDKFGTLSGGLSYETEVDIDDDTLDEETSDSEFESLADFRDRF